MNTLLLMASALLGVQNADPGDALEVTTSFNAPDAITPAIAPYVDCFTRAIDEGNQRVGAVHADGMRIIVIRAKAECADVRAQARASAIALIARDISVASHDREALIDRVFADIDHMGDTLIESIERADRARAGNAGGTER